MKSSVRGTVERFFRYLKERTAVLFLSLFTLHYQAARGR
jgi:hypothetical protein